MTAALAGKTVVVQIGTGGPPPDLWTDIVEVYEIGELPMERDDYDVTSHDSSLYREFISGLYSPIPFEISANYVATQYDELRTLRESGILGFYRILFPDSTTEEFEARVTKVSPVIPLDDRITYNVTLKINADVTRGTA